MGWISVIRGSHAAVDTGHPILLSQWTAAPREVDPTAVRHSCLDVAELAVCRAVLDALTVTACTAKRWDDNNRIAIAQDPDGDQWVTGWLHNGVPAFAEHDSWKHAHHHAAQQLDVMAESFIMTGNSTWAAEVASAYLRRSAHEVRGLVLTADLGDAVRSGEEMMRHERAITHIANGLGVQRTFLYRVFKGAEWGPHPARRQRRGARRRSEVSQ